MPIEHPYPAHPQPLPDEIFTSWIGRVARKNGVRFHYLCYLIAPEIKSINRNYDYCVSVNAVTRYAKKFNTPIDVALNTLTDSYEGYLFEKSTQRKNRKTLLLHTGVERTTKNRFYMQYCPLCLSEGVPYYRKHWRISFVTVCLKHNCQLLDRCPACNSHIDPTNQDVKDSPLPYMGSFADCFSCHEDLRNSNVKKANTALIYDTYWYLDILKKGYLLLNKNQWIYSFSFFSILKHLMRLVLEPHRNSYKEIRRINVDSLPHGLRYFAVAELVGIFNLWPNRFFEFCNQNKLHYYHFTSMIKTTRVIPYWFESVIKPELYTPNLEPSEESVHSAIKWMMKKNMRINITQLNCFMGYRDSLIIKQVLKRFQLQN